MANNAKATYGDVQKKTSKYLFLLTDINTDFSCCNRKVFLYLTYVLLNFSRKVINIKNTDMKLICSYTFKLCHVSEQH